MELGFTSWCEHHVPVWRTQGYDETWIRQRIETAQITRGFHCTLKEQGLTMLEIRDEFRKTYADHPELYDLAVERERIHPGFAIVGIQSISGNANGSNGKHLRATFHSKHGYRPEDSTPPWTG